MSKRLLAVGIGLAALVAFPAISSADTIDVFHGESIQRAVNHARNGDVIKVHHGIYRQSVEIKKSGLTLDGAGPQKKHGTVIKPNKHTRRCGGGAGVCIGSRSKRTTGTTVRGFLFRGFDDFGAVAFGARKTKFLHDKFINNGEYGVAAFGSVRTKFLHNTATGSGEAGFYVGVSKHARAVLKGDVARQNGEFGYFLRDSSHGRVLKSEAKDNCLGIGLINTGEGGGVRGWRIRDNSVRHNNSNCPPDEGAPPISGTGIALIGAKKNMLHSNVVLSNRPATSGAPFAGGIVVFSGKPLGGTLSAQNLIKRNDAHKNLPADIRWDGKGRGNRFRHNHCDTSQPSGLCG
jgi:hypothetical protein